MNGVPTLRPMDQHFQGVESILNNLGYIPVVSSVSGSLRGAYGTMQVGLALTLAVKLYAESKIYADNENLYLTESKHQLQYAMHGLTNIARGMVEAKFIIGNILTIIYDLSETRYRYETEDKDMPQVTFDTTLADMEGMFIELEKILNRLGHIPFVSYFSSGVRYKLGYFQVGMALLLALMHAAKAVYYKEEYETAKGQLDYIFHGLTNMGRAWFEKWFLIGNLFTAIYDAEGYRYKYKSEEAPEGYEALPQEDPEFSGQEINLLTAILDHIEQESDTEEEELKAAP